MLDQFAYEHPIEHPVIEWERIGGIKLNAGKTFGGGYRQRIVLKVRGKDLIPGNIRQLPGPITRGQSQFQDTLTWLEIDGRSRTFTSRINNFIAHVEP